MNKASCWMTGLPRAIKKGLVLLCDVALCFATAWVAFCLRFEELLTVSAGVILAGSVSALLVVLVFMAFGLYQAIFRYAGWYATLVLIKAVSVYAAMYAALFLLIGLENIPRSIGIIQPILLFIGVGSVRLAAKYLLAGKTRDRADLKVALIYGAGSAGRQIASGLRQGGEIRPIGFVDDDEALWKGFVNGLRVYAPAEIPKLLSSNMGITDLLLAIPSLGRRRQKEILSALSELPVHVRTVPGLSHLANGVVKVEDFREVEIDDVLGRESVVPNIDLMHRNVTGKVVLITGAGGSIGSELCRQILAQKPAALILFELSEFALYAIERELTQSSMLADRVIVPVLGSVLDRKKLTRVFQQYRVQTVFHAAAYKHVPLIEINPAAGILNNVFGTLCLVETACESGVETFVLISTDKAVRPTNVMGCSKRLAELVLQAKAIENQGSINTKLTMVRFGNVLGSSGSVIPVFREQIKKGGPVTVTHPEIIRYFMTIPEAAQLVVQAGAMGEGGDVMVLDMGEPVKIVDLARKMIYLSGLTCRDEQNPDGDIEIQFSGLRPGEKLYEELLIGGDTLPTDHSRILRAKEVALSWEVLEPILKDLEVAVRTEDSYSIYALLRRAVPEFKPQSVCSES